MAQLGLQLEQQMADLTANDELPAGIIQQWAKEELRRDVQQWHPKRQQPEQESEDDEEDAAAVAVSFQDIKSSMLGPCELSAYTSACLILLIAACMSGICLYIRAQCMRLNLPW